MVTAELAVLLPALVLLLVVGLRALAAGVGELSCVDAARVAARAAARGDSAAAATAAGQALVPHGVVVVVRVLGQVVSVEVTGSARVLPGLAIPLHARAVAQREGAP